MKLNAENDPADLARGKALEYSKLPGNEWAEGLAMDVARPLGEWNRALLPEMRQIAWR